VKPALQGRGARFFVENEGDDENPRWAASRKLEAGEEPIDVFGMPSPNIADFDGDGDLDLICGEFLDRFTYFENVGSREEPQFAAGRFLSYDGRVLRMDLQMITPTSVDWDGDGDVDLIAGDEDGRVAFIENTGEVTDGLPDFLPPRYFKQEADGLKFGALATPVGFDWDGDGDEDLISGNTAGHIGFFENLDGGDPPKWAAPVYVEEAVIMQVAGLSAGDHDTGIIYPSLSDADVVAAAADAAAAAVSASEADTDATAAAASAAAAAASAAGLTDEHIALVARSFG